MLAIPAVVQPGGSVRDQEVIDAADEHDIVMLHTGMRHFRHEHLSINHENYWH